VVTSTTSKLNPGCALECDLTRESWRFGTIAPHRAEDPSRALALLLKMATRARDAHDHRRTFP